MNPIDQLRDEINYLRFATTIDPQDKDRVLSLVEAVEDAYSTDVLPDEWKSFKQTLDTVLYGMRDRHIIEDLIASFNSVETELDDVGSE